MPSCSRVARRSGSRPAAGWQGTGSPSRGPRWFFAVGDAGLIPIVPWRRSCSTSLNGRAADKDLGVASRPTTRARLRRGPRRRVRIFRARQLRRRALGATTANFKGGIGSAIGRRHWAAQVRGRGSLRVVKCCRQRHNRRWAVVSGRTPFENRRRIWRERGMPASFTPEHAEPCASRAAPLRRRWKTPR